MEKRKQDGDQSMDVRKAQTYAAISTAMAPARQEQEQADLWSQHRGENEQREKEAQVDGCGGEAGACASAEAAARRVETRAPEGGR